MSFISSFWNLTSTNTQTTLPETPLEAIEISGLMPENSSGAPGASSLVGKRMLPLKRNNKMTPINSKLEPKPMPELSIESDDEEDGITLEPEDFFSDSSEIAKSPVSLEDSLQFAQEIDPQLPALSESSQNSEEEMLLEFEDLSPENFGIAQSLAPIKDLSRPNLEAKPQPLADNDMENSKNELPKEFEEPIAEEGNMPAQIQKPDLDKGAIDENSKAEFPKEFEEPIAEEGKMSAQNLKPALDEDAIDRIFVAVLPTIASPKPVADPVVQIMKVEKGLSVDLIEKPSIDEAPKEPSPVELPPVAVSKNRNDLFPESPREALPLTTTLATRADPVRLQRNELEVAALGTLAASIIPGSLALVAFYPKEGMEPSEELFMRSMAVLMLLVCLIGTMYTAYTGKSL